MRNMQLNKSVPLIHCTQNLFGLLIFCLVFTLVISVKDRPENVLH